MPAANFVQAGSGTAILTGSGTVSMTGATAGNLVAIHLVARGTTVDWSAFSSITNLSDLAGTANAVSWIVNGITVSTTLDCGIALARVTANGTVSADATVGASGEDLFLRMYEFQGEAQGTTVATVVEAGAGTYDTGSGTSTSSIGGAGFTTNDVDRLVLQFVALSTNTTTSDYTGETGIDLAEAVAEFSSASGATATLQLQTGAMPSAGTFAPGNFTAGAATDFLVLGTAIIPDTTPSTAGIRLVRSGLRW